MKKFIDVEKFVNAVVEGKPYKEEFKSVKFLPPIHFDKAVSKIEKKEVEDLKNDIFCYLNYVETIDDLKELITNMVNAINDYERNNKKKIVTEETF